MYSTLLRPVIGSLHRANKDFFLYILNSIHLLKLSLCPSTPTSPSSWNYLSISNCQKIPFEFYSIPTCAGMFLLCSLFPLKKTSSSIYITSSDSISFLLWLKSIPSKFMAHRSLWCLFHFTFFSVYLLTYTFLNWV